MMEGKISEDVQKVALLSEDDVEAQPTVAPKPPIPVHRWVIATMFAAVLLLSWIPGPQYVEDWSAENLAYGTQITTTASPKSVADGASAEPLSAPLCVTPECVHAASEILYNLSPEYKDLDPCTDFEELVCGGWKDRHDLRPDQGDAFTGTYMFESSQTLLRHILESPYPQSSAHSYFSPAWLGSLRRSADEDNFHKLQSAYDACLDEKTIRDAGTQPMLDLLHGTFVDCLSDSNNPFFCLQKIGVTALISLGTGADDKDPDTVVTSVSAPYRIGLPAKELYKDTVILKKYEKVLAEAISGFYPNGTFEDHLFHNVADFERQLAAASPDAEDRNDVTVSNMLRSLTSAYLKKYYNPMTLDEADAIAPSVELKKTIQKLAPSSVDIDRVIVMAPQYLRSLEKTLSETSNDTLRAYFVWKVIQSYAEYIEVDAVASYKRFVNELNGKDPESVPERWRVCVNHVDGGLGWILSRFFVERAFSADAKNFGDQIVSDIKSLFIEKLKATEWMEESVTNLAIDKVHNIIQKIGYPSKSPDIMDPDVLSNYYRHTRIDSSYLENAVRMTRQEVSREWEALTGPVDRSEWGMTVPTVNAYYNPPGNEIVFPAGIMQFPVFDVNLPAYLSYGAFGSVSGHELSHAFDSTGRHYDQNGNYTDWWTPATIAAFEERAECFVEQYANFTLEGSGGKTLHVNGRLTLGENIADAGGVSAAFAAWKQRAHEVPNADLPGLEHFSQEQLFFVSYANWWCGKSTKETAENRIYTDPHAPKWARVLGTMANSRDFKESFGCKSKEPVCELW